MRTETILLELAYDGAVFHGLAAQPGLCTVAGELRSKLRDAFGEDVRALTFSARTDAGVDARQNFATFRVRQTARLTRILAELTAATHQDHALRLLSARCVPRSVNARTSAIGKVYRYKIRDGVDAPRFERGCWEIWPTLDVAQMSRAAELLVGEHNFSSFRASGCHGKGAVKRITRLQIHRQTEFVEILIAGNGFLRKMVRIMSGTLAEIGAGLRGAGQIVTILQAANRSAAGVTAPARGLTLYQVDLMQ